MALRLFRRTASGKLSSLNEVDTVSRSFSTSSYQRFNSSSSRRFGSSFTTATALATAAVTAATVAFAAADDKKNDVNYDAVRKDIASILDAPNYDDGSYGPLFVRLAWHSAGTFDKTDGSGGSNGGRIRFHPELNWGANKGLDLAIKLLQPIKDKYPSLTYADLFTLAGVVAIEEMGGPKINWVPGRSDFNDGKTSPPDGRLPDALRKQDHLRSIFHRMGLDDRDIVALSGAHSLGRCHTSRSGFDGPWTNAPTTVSNEYFRLLVEEQWVERQWNGPKQYQDKKTGQLMMLVSDLALLDDPIFSKYVRYYASNEQAWRDDFARAFSKLLHLGVVAEPKTLFQRIFG